MAPGNPDTPPRIVEDSKEDRLIKVVVEKTVGMQATRKGKEKTVEAIETPSKHVPDHRLFMCNIEPANYDECLEEPVLSEKASLPRRVEEDGNQNDNDYLQEGEQAFLFFVNAKRQIDQLDRESAIDKYLSRPAPASKCHPQAQENSGSFRSKRYFVRRVPRQVDGDAKSTQI